MLPSERLRLNASKSESLPVRGDAAGVPPEGGPRQRPRTPFLPWGAGPTPPTPPAARRGREPRRNPNRRLERDARSLADDLGMDRGVVPSRAAASLRSAETNPFDPRDLSALLGRANSPAPSVGFFITMLNSVNMQHCYAIFREPLKTPNLPCRQAPSPRKDPLFSNFWNLPAE